MPVSFDEKRIFVSSGENDAPPMLIVAMNCSTVYCFGLRDFVAGAARASAGTSSAAASRRRVRFMRGLLCWKTTTLGGGRSSRDRPRKFEFRIANSELRNGSRQAIASPDPLPFLNSEFGSSNFELPWPDRASLRPEHELVPFRVPEDCRGAPRLRLFE